MIYCIGSRCRRVAVLNRKVSNKRNASDVSLQLEYFFTKMIDNVIFFSFSNQFLLSTSGSTQLSKP